uniref:Uncharacterized protein MANES_12G008800 n=1 Tax=Rhizophora mucronata TaxID=61149 RepID=A0A2P2MLV9_RHIMU
MPEIKSETFERRPSFARTDPIIPAPARIAILPTVTAIERATANDYEISASESRFAARRPSFHVT